MNHAEGGIADYNQAIHSIRQVLRLLQKGKFYKNVFLFMSVSGIRLFKHSFKCLDS